VRLRGPWSRCRRQTLVTERREPVVRGHHTSDYVYPHLSLGIEDFAKLKRFLSDYGPLTTDHAPHAP